MTAFVCLTNSNIFLATYYSYILQSTKYTLIFQHRHKITKKHIISVSYRFQADFLPSKYAIRRYSLLKTTSCCQHQCLVVSRCFPATHIYCLYCDITGVISKDLFTLDLQDYRYLQHPTSQPVSGISIIKLHLHKMEISRKRLGDHKMQ